MIRFHWPRDAHWAAMMRLPRWHRPFSVKGRKHLIGCGCGVLVMMSGSALAVAHLDVIIPHVMWDCLAYFIHGCGAVPIMSHIEPLWVMLTEE